MYKMFIDSIYARRHPYFITESHLIIDHFSTACAGFGEEGCDSGRKTFVEDSSDLEGLRQAHQLLRQRFTVGQLAALAFPDLPYTLEQIFFYAFASLACTADDHEDDLQNGTRSLPIVRVNGVLSQMPEFTRTFNCFDGEPMNAPEKSVCYLFGENAVSTEDRS
ncbi:hypothetical protein PFISCL1PPCAC_26916, partial [Pristionchus fissidentatus]